MYFFYNLGLASNICKIVLNFFLTLCPPHLHSISNCVPQLYGAAPLKQLIRSSSYEIDYFIVIKNFLNPEGHQNTIPKYQSYCHFTEGVDFACWWSCIEKGLPLQPAQQACFWVLIFWVFIEYIQIVEYKPKKVLNQFFRRNIWPGTSVRKKWDLKFKLWAYPFVLVGGFP